MDDVLCAYEVDARVERLSQLSGRPPAEIHGALWESGFLDEADRGRWDERETLAEFGRRIRYPLSLEEWVEARRIAMRPFPEVLALLERVKVHADIALLTNNDPLVEATLPSLFPELPPLFGEHLYVSSRFGVSKPDPAVFRACCAALASPRRRRSSPTIERRTWREPFRRGWSVMFSRAPKSSTAR